MATDIQLYLVDESGEKMWSGRVAAPFPAAEVGARLFVSVGRETRWVRVQRVARGVEGSGAKATAAIRLVVDPANEPSTEPSTEPAIAQAPVRSTEMVDHGEHGMIGANGGSVDLADGDIIVTVGKYTTISENVILLTVQLSSPSGPTVVTKSDANVGTAVEAEDELRIVTATLTQASRENTKVRITEHVKK